MALSQPTSSTTSRSQPPQTSADHLVSLQERHSTTHVESATVRTAPSTTDTAVAGASSNAALNSQGNNYKHRQSTLSISSSKQNRTRLFTLAALARDKTPRAIANLSESSIRSRLSSSSVHRSVRGSPTSALQEPSQIGRLTDKQSRQYRFIEYQQYSGFLPFAYENRDSRYSHVTSSAA
ncbi:hypothetical protein B0J14DRAFT_157840 [Halenospora varia]|nr:hypothetical protein B0J14DRAFT_157840 [Halenospora varia]